MSEERNDRVTPDLLGPMVEQPEPSVDGAWYVVSLAQLVTEGYTHIEFHFDDGERRPNDASLIADGEGA